MKLKMLFVILSIELFSCSTRVETDDKSVKKIITVTEFLILNEDFNTVDTIHQQKGIKKFDVNNKILEEMDFYGPSLKFGGGLISKYDQIGNKVKEYLITF